MIKNKKAIVLFLLILSTNAQATTSLGVIDFGEPLKNVEKGTEALKGIKGFIDKAMAIWDPINEKIFSFWHQYLEKYLGKYANQIKENIKQGIGEERGELSEGFKVGVEKFLDYIKNIFSRFF